MKPYSRVVGSVERIHPGEEVHESARGFGGASWRAICPYVVAGCEHPHSPQMVLAHPLQVLLQAAAEGKDGWARKDRY